MEIAEPLRILIEELTKLPSIGRKSAQRLALHMVKKDKVELQSLISALSDIKDKIRHCSICYNISVEEILIVLKKREMTLYQLLYSLF